MSDLRRTDSHLPIDAGAPDDRDAHIERLLLAGLDHYFTSDYERAIHVWTRVLFLDRGHARARAYIDRARSAQAERHRESEELLHKGVAAFDRRDTDAARRLLTSAVDRGAPREIALSFLERLDRLDTGVQPDAPSATPAASPSPRWKAVSRVRPSRSSRSAPWFAAVLVAAAAGLALYSAASWQRLDPMFLKVEQPRAGEAGVSSLREEPLPVPRSAEIALARARTLYATGRLRDALRLLDQVASTDPLRSEVDRFRADIQRDLLSTVGSMKPGATGGKPAPLASSHDRLDPNE